MQALTIRRMVAALSLFTLAGCGGTAVVAGDGGGVSPPVRSETPTSTAIPTVLPATATPTPATPVPTVQRPPAAQAPAPMTFAISPVFPGGAAGTITAVSSSSGVHYHVVVTGLPAASVHTIHDHAGTCGSAPGSRHLAVLITATADAHGVIVFDTTVPAADFGARRILIVYENAKPLLITGCATL